MTFGLSCETLGSPLGFSTDDMFLRVVAYGVTPVVPGSTVRSNVVKLPTGGYSPGECDVYIRMLTPVLRLDGNGKYYCMPIERRDGVGKYWNVNSSTWRYTYWGSRYLDRNYVDDPELPANLGAGLWLDLPGAVEYYVVVRSNANLPLTGWGLVVFDESGDQTFNSGHTLGYITQVHTFTGNAPLYWSTNLYLTAGEFIRVPTPAEYAWPTHATWDSTGNRLCPFVTPVFESDNTFNHQYTLGTFDYDDGGGLNTDQSTRMICSSGYLAAHASAGYPAVYTHSAATAATEWAALPNYTPIEVMRFR